MHFMQLSALLKRRLIRLCVLFLALILLGFLLPETMHIPVQGAGPKDWNHQTFWHYPWGTSGVHKGIDIFGHKGQEIISATYGLVIFKGELGIGGKVVIVLGPKWRMHYYAHLDEYKTGFGSLLSGGESVGTMGNSGNAVNKPTHLHYTIFTPIPYFWRWDDSRQGWLKPFFLDPSEKLLAK